LNGWKIVPVIILVPEYLESLRTLEFFCPTGLSVVQMYRHLKTVLPERGRVGSTL